MLDEAPPFWWTRPGPLAYLLSPAGFAYGRLSALRMSRPAKYSAGVPVLCIGNFVVGGAGKTPAALAFGRAARKKGRKPGFLSRGYGGMLAGPVVVNPKKHRATEVGDEPLELAQKETTVIAADRGTGAALLVARGCDFIIMDDGFQNPGLAKDYSLAVVDAKRGLGNGFQIPAGPMRGPLGLQLARADGVLVVGDGAGGDMVIRLAARRGKPIFAGSVRPATPRSRWRNRRVLAYAGIADPDKLFNSLADAGAVLVETRAFPDHHPYLEDEAQELLDVAQTAGLDLVTTGKDLVRLQGNTPMLDELAAKSEIFPIRLEFDDQRTGEIVVDMAIRNFENRRHL